MIRNMHRTRILAMALCAISCALPAFSAVWYVKKDAAPGGDGTSWATAYQTIEPAVDAAAADGGGEVWIAAGVYDEVRSQEDGALELPSYIALIGGFRGDEHTLEMRNWAANETTISGEFSHDGHRATCTVRSIGQENLVDGITVTQATSYGLQSFFDSVIRNCTISQIGEVSSMRGAGIQAWRSLIENCFIEENYGRGIVGYSVTLLDSVVTRNGNSSFFGTQLGACQIIRTEFSHHGDGAITLASKTVAEVVFRDCVFRRNVGRDGAAVNYFEYADGIDGVNRPTVFLNCVFESNEAIKPPTAQAGGRGGAVFVETQADKKRSSHANEKSGGYQFWHYAPPLFINCTFRGNRAESGGALYWLDNPFGKHIEEQTSIDSMVIANCIFWDNGPAPITGNYANVAQSVFTHCIIEGGFPGTSILNVNPQFRDAANGDYTLLRTSPAIDRGRDTSGVAYGSVVTDILGNPRGVDGDLLGPVTGDGSEYDIGAYEFIPVWHAADSNESGALDLPELLRIIQFYNTGALHCNAATEDGYAPGADATAQDCFPHSSDYNPQDWRIDLNELLRAIQFYNTGGYTYCPESGTEDGFCPVGSGL